MRETSISRSAVSKELDLPTCDRHKRTDGHSWATAYTAIAQRRAVKKRKTPIFSLLLRRMKSPVHRTWEVCFIVHLENCFSDSMNTFAAKVCRFGGNAIIEVKLLLKLQNPLIPPNLKH